MGKCMQDYFAVNPLEDPVVKSTLEEVNMSGQQLIEMSVKELNKRLASCSSFVVGKLKKCRRTLKNRGYAKSCRIKRIVAKSELEQINARLLAELTELKQHNRSLVDQVRGLLSATTPGGGGGGGGGDGGGDGGAYFSGGLSPTKGRHQMEGIRYELAADGPRQQHLLQQQKSQQHEHFHHQHTDQMHNAEPAGYHGLGRHQHHHSSGSSTCNSSPVSSSSSIYGTGGVDAACRVSLAAELDFVLDDRHQQAAGCHDAGGQASNATASPVRVATIYGELPACWSAMGQHQQAHGASVDFH